MSGRQPMTPPISPDPRELLTNNELDQARESQPGDLGPRSPRSDSPDLRALPSHPRDATDDGFLYDVFISYRHLEPDKSWVRGTLESRLAAAGLRVCIDYRSFRLGAALVNEMTRAVEQSRYTLAVLTPRYLESNFTELENVLAEHLGLETTAMRLLTIKREPCRPRLGLRARLALDMTDDAELEDNLAQLVAALRQSVTST